MYGKSGGRKRSSCILEWSILPPNVEHSVVSSFMEQNMDLKEAIYSRRAVREFTRQTVDQTTIRDLIDAAVQAPSAVNEQPWLFSVVRDKTILDWISDESKTYMLRNPPRGIRPQDIQELTEDPQFNIFYYAPVLIVISSVTDNQWVIENCALAAENLMLSACAAGLGTCWIGFAQSWLGTPDGKEAIGLQIGCVPVAPIIVGHPKSAPLPVHRKQPEIRWIGRDD
jgi:nitroreductase